MTALCTWGCKHHHIQSPQASSKVDVEKVRLKEGWDTPEVTHKHKYQNSELLDRSRLSESKQSREALSNLTGIDAEWSRIVLPDDKIKNPLVPVTAAEGAGGDGLIDRQGWVSTFHGRSYLGPTQQDQCHLLNSLSAQLASQNQIPGERVRVWAT